MFYHRNGPTGPLANESRQERNRREHHALLLEGHAQGIIVYSGRQPVGWCQFGRREDLPRVEQGRKYKSVAAALGEPPRWRITCFFVDRPVRRRGVARVALRAALEVIEGQGGGIVEAYPATHGKAVAVWFGSQGMFEREGFRIIRPFGKSNVLMRRELPDARRAGTRRRGS
ncbi:MAG: GNAT family N-acetyltransferase [Thermoplasmata archaeon]